MAGEQRWTWPEQTVRACARYLETGPVKGVRFPYEHRAQAHGSNGPALFISWNVTVLGGEAENFADIGPGCARIRAVNPA